MSDSKPTIVVRERVDIGDDFFTGASYLHKVWTDGREEWVKMTFEPSTAGTIRQELSREEWEQATTGYEPVSVIENSDWGYGRAVRQ